MEIVGALLRADPAMRVTAAEALEYPWLLPPEQQFRFRVEPRVTQLSTSGAQCTPQHQLAELGAPPEELNTPTHYPHTAKALYLFDGAKYSSKQTVVILHV